MIPRLLLFGTLVGCPSTPTDPDPVDSPDPMSPGETATPTGDTAPPPDTPPVASIVLPKSDLSAFYDDYDDTLDLWFKDVELRGRGTDAEDGTLAGASLVWTTDRSDIQTAALGTGETLTVRLYSNDCFGVTHILTLSVTDADGNTTTDTVEVFIYTVC
ncbi:MAG: hypothetical protein AAF602_26330 [Myxococcota bacterium]